MRRGSIFTSSVIGYDKIILGNDIFMILSFELHLRKIGRYSVQKQLNVPEIFRSIFHNISCNHYRIIGSDHYLIN